MLFSIHAKNSENRQTEILLQQTAAHNGALLSVLHKKLKCLSFVRKKKYFRHRWTDREQLKVYSKGTAKDIFQLE